MRWSERLATGFVPLMARLLLCAALLPLGWQKMFTTRSYTPRESATLASVGVTPDGVDFGRVRATGPAWARGEATIADAAPSSSPLVARSLYGVALVCQEHALPWPAIAAWGVAVVEVVAPVLLLLGFLARVAAACVACVMVGAFATSSFGALRAAGWWSLPIDEYFRLWKQCGLFALALTVVLVGAGWFTIESALDGGGRSATAKPKSKRDSSDE